MDLYHLREEAEPSDRTALEAVVDHIKEEMARLNPLEEEILSTGGPPTQRLGGISKRRGEQVMVRRVGDLPQPQGTAPTRRLGPRTFRLARHCRKLVLPHPFWPSRP